MPFGDADIHIFPSEPAALNVTGALGLGSANTLVNYDDLSCGPLAPLTDPEPWGALRGGFWRAAGSEDADTAAQLFEELVQQRTRLRRAGAIRLWIGAALGEQLLCAWLGAALERIGTDRSLLTLVDLDSAPYPARPVRSVGVLNHKDVRYVADRWSALDDDRCAAYAAMWRAVSHETPELLGAFCAAESPCPPHLRKILANYMLHYPDVETGLCHWDRELLDSCRKNAPHTLHIMADVLGGGIDRPYYSVPGPGYLFHRLKRLGDPRLPYPLFKLSGDRTDMRALETWLSDAGLAVLEGEENAVALNGIDEIIGGVRLSLPGGPLWLFDGETLVAADLPVAG